MFINGSELNEQSLQMTFQGCFLPSFDSFGQAVSEQKIFQKSTNQLQKLPLVAMFVNGSELNEQALQRTFQGCFLPVTKFRFIWPSGYRDDFLEINQSEIRIVWRPCLITDWDEMSILYRGPAIDASYQVSVHLINWFQRRRLKKISQSETRIAYGGHVC